jgi:hypothetical protein
VDQDPSRSKYMQIVKFAMSALKLTNATYRILVTVVMGYYLIREVVSYERSRYRESKRDVM